MDLTELGRLADGCIHCGLCLTACPTYLETGSEADSPRGRIYLMRGMIEGWQAPEPEATIHLDRCLGCRACETACPSGVQYGHLLEGVRGTLTEPARPAGWRSTFWRFLIRQVLPRRNLFALAIRPLQWLPAVLLPGFLRRQQAVLPATPAMPPLPPFTAAVGIRRGRVGFLAGCAMPVLYPAAGHAAVKLLAEAGFDVVVPQAAVCCGALQAHDGDLAGAQANRDRTMAALGDCDWIVTHSAGCGAAMKDYPEGFAQRVRDLSEALLQADWQPARQPLAGKHVAYHDPCHLAHGQGIRQPPRELLIRAGATLVPVEGAELCCGGAGTYSMLQPELSGQLEQRKVQSLLAGAPDLVVTANPSCLMQIGHGLAGRKPLLHLAEALAGSGS